MVDYTKFKEYFEDDSVEKQWHFEEWHPFSPTQPPTIVITNAELVAESVELTESLCSEENIRFNVIEHNMLKFSISNTYPDLFEYIFRVSIEFPSFSTARTDWFQVGYFRVKSDKVSSDRETRDIVAYDLLNKFINSRYKWWYNGLFERYETVTLKQFRDSFFEAFKGYHPWITQEQTTLMNDTLTLKKSKKIKKPTVRDILGVICEMNGVIGHIDRDNTFRYIDVANMTNIARPDDYLSIANECESFETAKIDRVEVLSQSGEVLGYSGEEEDDAENTYTIENNFALKGLGDGTAGQEAAHYIASHLMEHFENFSYVPFDAEFKGNPCIEVGDWIRFHSHGVTVQSLIVSRQMKGIQSLHDTFNASGSQEYQGDANTLSDRIKNLEQQIGKNDPASNVQVVPIATSGNQVAKIIIDGTEYMLYAPKGGSSIPSFRGIHDVELLTDVSVIED